MYIYIHTIYIQQKKVNEQKTHNPCAGCAARSLRTTLRTTPCAQPCKPLCATLHGHNYREFLTRCRT